MKSKKKKTFKAILFIIGIILVIGVGMIAYLVVSDLKQEDILKKEIVNVSNKDFLKDDFSIKVKTTGDYAYIEEAVKKFYKELSDSIRVMNKYLNDENLINILSADNLQADGPDFVSSYQILKEVRENSTGAIQKIVSLCNEDTIKSLIDKEKVDDYSYELYLQLMYTEDDLKEFAETKVEMQTLSTNLNLFLDKVEEMLNMLEENSNYWTIDDGQLYFDSDTLVDEYNKLYNELNQIVIEKFSDSNGSLENEKNSI